MSKIEDELVINNVETCIQIDGIHASHGVMAVESTNVEPVDAEMANDLEEHDAMVVDAVVGKSLRSQSRYRLLLTLIFVYSQMAA